MKKLFALFLVVAMLAVAGGAFAADDDAGHVTPTPAPGEKIETVTNVKVVNVTVAKLPTIAQIKQVAATVITRVETIRTTIVNQFTTIGVTVPANAQVQSATNIADATTSNYRAGDNTGNLQRAAAMLKKKSGGNTLRAIGVVPPFKPDAAGLQPFSLGTLNSAFWGKVLGIDMNAADVSSAEFSAATAAGGNEVVFLNASGDVITTVPSGDVTAVAYVLAGQTYSPIVITSVSSADEASFDAETGTTTVASVDVAVESGEVVPTIDAKVQELINLGYVSSDAKTLLPAAFSGDVPALRTAFGSDTLRTADIALKFNVATWYAYENGARVDTAEVSAASATLTKNTANDREAYFFADTDDYAQGTSVSLSFGVIPTGASSDITPLQYTLGSVDGTYSENPRGVGSSSGGCASMGSVLAVAVLGAFIAARKK
jgi:hypothetical protein